MTDTITTTTTTNSERNTPLPPEGDYLLTITGTVNRPQHWVRVKDGVLSMRRKGHIDWDDATDDLTTSWNRGDGIWELSPLPENHTPHCDPTWTNWETDSPLPWPGDYTLTINTLSKNSTVTRYHWVKIIDGDLKIRQYEHEDWDNPTSILDTWRTGTGCWTLSEGKPEGKAAEPEQEEKATEAEEKASAELTPGSLYLLNGRYMLAVSTAGLMPLGGEGETTLDVEGAEFACGPKDDEWGVRLSHMRRTLSQSAKSANTRADDLQRWKDNVGEALRDQAKKRGWCEEYEDFAENWDLPIREYEYNVNISIQVRARSQEAAYEMVDDELGISSNDDFVSSGPHSAVERAY